MTGRDAPIIETDRLRMRPQALQDFAFFEAIWADPAVNEFIGGKPRPREEVWMKFLRNAGFWSMLGYGCWAVEEKDGALVGEAGFGEFKRNMPPLIESTPEAGWVFSPTAFGKAVRYGNCGPDCSVGG